MAANPPIKRIFWSRTSTRPCSIFTSTDTALHCRWSFFSCCWFSRSCFCNEPTRRKECCNAGSQRTTLDHDWPARRVVAVRADFAFIRRSTCFRFRCDRETNCAALIWRSFPDNWTLASYQQLFTEQPFLQWLGNSLLVSLAVTVLGVTLAAVGGYALSRFKFVGRQGEHVGDFDDSDVPGDDAVVAAVRDDRPVAPGQHVSGVVDLLLRRRHCRFACGR